MLDHVSHTPGPYKVERRFDICQKRDGYGGTYIGTTRGNGELPESVNRQCEADARLLAASPEMFDLCMRVWQESDQDELRLAAESAVKLAMYGDEADANPPT